MKGKEREGNREEKGRKDLPSHTHVHTKTKKGWDLSAVLESQVWEGGKPGWVCCHPSVHTLQVGSERTASGLPPALGSPLYQELELAQELGGLRAGQGRPE
jgi:hypothetical protein